MPTDPVRTQFEAKVTDDMLWAAINVMNRLGRPISLFDMRSVLNAALATQDGGEHETAGWEPIGTAPMDGTVIQLLQGGEAFAGFAGDDPDHPWQFLDRNGRQAFVNGFHHKSSPRWWRPLAKAPNGAALRAAQEGEK